MRRSRTLLTAILFVASTACTSGSNTDSADVLLTLSGSGDRVSAPIEIDGPVQVCWETVSDGPAGVSTVGFLRADTRQLVGGVDAEKPDECVLVGGRTIHLDSGTYAIEVLAADEVDWRLTIRRD